jgi:sec-independent protein translocase protein TatA
MTIYSISASRGFIMSLGFGEILVILLVILIVFGAGKLPKVMGDLGKGIKSFKEGMDSDDKKPEEKK